MRPTKTTNNRGLVPRKECLALQTGRYELSADAWDPISYRPFAKQWDIYSLVFVAMAYTCSVGDEIAFLDAPTTGLVCLPYRSR